MFLLKVTSKLGLLPLLRVGRVPFSSPLPSTHRQHRMLPGYQPIVSSGTAPGSVSPYCQLRCDDTGLDLRACCAPTFAKPSTTSPGLASLTSKSDITWQMWLETPPLHGVADTTQVGGPKQPQSRPANVDTARLRTRVRHVGPGKARRETTQGNTRPTSMADIHAETSHYTLPLWPHGARGQYQHRGCLLL